MKRTREIIGKAAKENKSDKTWTWESGKTFEFGAVQYEDDKTDWQGHPNDLKAFDEITEFSESQYVFICGWTRTTVEGQRERVIVTGNPPTTQEGRWVVGRWAAWLDHDYPDPAEDGELRWYATIDGEEQEYKTGDIIVHDGEEIQPRSRTFIRATLDDNTFLSRDNTYRSVLQSLPEPLRSQMLHGDFSANIEVDAFQVIPTAWAKLAQQRWLEREKPDTPLTSAGVDPNRGGKDNMGIAKLYDNWFDEVEKYSGAVVKDGAIAAELIRQSLGDTKAPIGIDVIKNAKHAC